MKKVQYDKREDGQPFNVSIKKGTEKKEKK